jgi:trans-2,3-dihydro-3-hydroxyanthranilate isomerase
MRVRRYRYLHYDVFTDRRFGGNQLAVFPEAAGLPARTMQQIAREIGFAETTFVEPPVDRESDVRMRIFTPEVEMPMAGHPVIGSTFALARERRIPASRGSWVFGLNIGALTVDLEWREQALTFVWMTQPLPEFGPTFDPSAVATALGVPDRSSTATGLPIEQVSCGIPFVMVPMETRKAVDAAVPDTRAFDALAHTTGHNHFSVYLFTTEAGADQATVYTRMFAPGLGVYEDPATGSASGPLGCYLVRHAVIPPDRAGSILNLQGARLGRPSWIHIAIESSGGAISRVRVGGRSVFVAEGSMEVEEEGRC